MTVMLGKLYAALKAAGASDRDAQAAAEEAGDLHDQFGGLQTATHEMHADIKSELSGMRGEFRDGLAKVSDGLAKVTGGLADVRAEVAYLRGRFDVLIWAVGINAAATIAILGVLLRH